MLNWLAGRSLLTVSSRAVFCLPPAQRCGSSADWGSIGRKPAGIHCREAVSRSVPKGWCGPSVFVSVRGDVVSSL
jgi:hypothetical protein